MSRISFKENLKLVELVGTRYTGAGCCTSRIATVDGLCRHLQATSAHQSIEAIASLLLRGSDHGLVKRGITRVEERLRATNVILTLILITLIANLLVRFLGIP